MADILHDMNVRAPINRVFDAVATPGGLDEWWTERSSGSPELGAEYVLEFTPEYVWRAEVTKCDAPREFELTITEALDDWIGTKVGFTLSESADGTTLLCFRHSGWAEASAHFRNSSFCWALYLRVMREFVEKGKRVPYADRYSA